MKVLEWHGQSVGLNPTEVLWRDLKRAIYAHKPSTVVELEQICKEEPKFFHIDV